MRSPRIPRIPLRVWKSMGHIKRRRFCPYCDTRSRDKIDRRTYDQHVGRHEQLGMYPVWGRP